MELKSTYQGQVACELGAVPACSLAVALASLDRHCNRGLGALPLTLGEAGVRALASLQSGTEFEGQPQQTW